MKLDQDRKLENTLHFIMFSSIYALYPKASVCIEHGFSHGIYVTLKNCRLTSKKLGCIEEKMKQLIQADLNIYKKEFTKEEANKVLSKYPSNSFIEHFDHIPDHVILYELDGYFDWIYGDLYEHTGVLSTFYIRRYANGFWLGSEDRFENQTHLFQVQQEFERWGNRIGINNIFELNQVVYEKGMNDLVLMSEIKTETNLSRMTQEIVAHVPNIRFVLISGPSSAGKTTLSRRLALHLKLSGKNVFTIAMDDFYKNREDTPKKSDGSYDFECLEAIDLDLFHNILMDMIEQEEVTLPYFDFKSGTRMYKDTPIRLKEDSIIIIEGIHGLNPRIRDYLPQESTYRIYINALTNLNIDDHNYIRTSDYRLIRRIARDSKMRGRNANAVIQAKQSVQEGEYLYIYPYQEQADFIFNTSLIYELSILTNIVKPLLLEIKEDDASYSQGRRLLQLLDFIQETTSTCIPRTSILQEFLANSIFEEEKR